MKEWTLDRNVELNSVLFNIAVVFIVYGNGE